MGWKTESMKFVRAYDHSGLFNDFHCPLTAVELMGFGRICFYKTQT